jgi:hypothetical protein
MVYLTSNAGCTSSPLCAYNVWARLRAAESAGRCCGCWRRVFDGDSNQNRTRKRRSGPRRGISGIRVSAAVLVPGARRRPASRHSEWRDDSAYGPREATDRASVPRTRSLRPLASPTAVERGSASPPAAASLKSTLNLDGSIWIFFDQKSIKKPSSKGVRLLGMAGLEPETRRLVKRA